MNRKVLQKVIDELNKPEPKLDYIRGILETIIEGMPEEKLAPVLILPNPGSAIPAQIGLEDDMASILDQQARTGLEKIKNV